MYIGSFMVGAGRRSLRAAGRSARLGQLPLACRRPPAPTAAPPAPLPPPTAPPPRSGPQHCPQQHLTARYLADPEPNHPVRGRCQEGMRVRAGRPAGCCARAARCGCWRPTTPTSHPAAPRCAWLRGGRAVAAADTVGRHTCSKLSPHHACTHPHPHPHPHTHSSAIPVVTCVLAIVVKSRYPCRQELLALVMLTAGVMLAVVAGARRRGVGGGGGVERVAYWRVCLPWPAAAGLWRTPAAHHLAPVQGTVTGQAICHCLLPGGHRVQRRHDDLQRQGAQVSG